MLYGATIDKESISYWEGKLKNNQWMRVFPNSDGLPPVPTDERFKYARKAGMRNIFVSSKIRAKFAVDGKQFGDGLVAVGQRLSLLAQSGGFDVIWFADHHEPENDYPGGAEAYKNDQLVVAEYIDLMNLSSPIPIKFGHVLTKQWTEDPKKGDGDYSKFDTGLGHFLAFDVYDDAWNHGDPKKVATSFIAPAELLKNIKKYKFDSNDSRDRVIAEYGAIGKPFDRDGAARAAWIEAFYREVKAWDATGTGSRLVGVILWNQLGKPGASLEGIGARRDFRLDIRQGKDNATYPISPALALDRWNEIADWERVPSTDSVETQLNRAFENGFHAGWKAGQEQYKEDVVQGLPPIRP